MSRKRSAKIPDPYVFGIGGHRGKYIFGEVHELYGKRFCQRFERAWRLETQFQLESTTMRHFKAIRKALEWIGRRANAGREDTAERRVFTGFRDIVEYVPSEKEWGEVVSNITGSILSYGDKSFVDSVKPKTRNELIHSLRTALLWLSRQGMIPEVPIGGRLDARYSDQTPCLATLSFNAGRLDISGLSPEQAAEAFVQRNREMLDELNKVLSAELRENHDLFMIGKQRLADNSLSSIDELQRRIAELTTTEDIRCGRALQKVGLSDDQGLTLILKILHHRKNGGGTILSEEKFRALLNSISNFDDAQCYLEGTTRALNAAFHIVLMDAGANTQPVEDLAFEPYVGQSKRGQRQLRTLQTVKNRALGKQISLHLRSDDMHVSTRAASGCMPGTEAIRLWKDLSEPLRCANGPTKERLWVWRLPNQSAVRTSLPSLASEWWPAFLKRIASNPLVGGLPITRQVLRKAKANSIRNSEFELQVQSAVMGHESVSTTFPYLSESGILAYLNSQIRNFLNQWEAAAVSSVRMAARKLGVAEADLYRLQQLGIANGLEFAAVDRMRPPTAEGVEDTIVLPSRVKSLSITNQSLRKLELARRALRDQFAKMVNVNPKRFVRVWIPFMAIVEGYVQRVSESRFKLRYKKICGKIEEEIAAGTVEAPLLW